MECFSAGSLVVALARIDCESETLRMLRCHYEIAMLLSATSEAFLIFGVVTLRRNLESVYAVYDLLPLIRDPKPEPCSAFWLCHSVYGHGDPFSLLHDG